MKVYHTWASHSVVGVGKDSGMMEVGKDSGMMGVGKDSSMCMSGSHLISWHDM